MKFAIITHVNHVNKGGNYFGYAPYIREMNIWLKFVDQLIVVASSTRKITTEIDLNYKHDKINFRKIPDFNFTSLRDTIIAFFKLPMIFWKIFWAMQEADHIHLRCPGNVGLIGCFVQILFPNKNKTAKYAGNWDPKSKQPWTYKLQKWILGNTFLTRNMQVLVYGEWPNQSKNIVSFFTATYSEEEKETIEKTNLESGIKFIFVGSLVSGKDPMYAIKLIHQLIDNGNKVKLDLYGEGSERNRLVSYIEIHKLEKSITLKGNQNQETIKEAYQKSHFVILPSKSEGWPKAIAEGMFWGCVPISTPVSCVPYMLDFGNRGILLEMNLDKDFIQIENLLLDQHTFFSKSKMSLLWSQYYTTDIFESEIKNLLQK